jgi:hypothetical protein
MSPPRGFGEAHVSPTDHDEVESFGQLEPLVATEKEGEGQASTPSYALIRSLFSAEYSGGGGK